MGVSTHLTALIISERMPLSNHRVVRLKRTLSHVGDVGGRDQSSGPPGVSNHALSPRPPCSLRLSSVPCRPCTVEAAGKKAPLSDHAPKSLRGDTASSSAAAAQRTSKNAQRGVDGRGVSWRPRGGPQLPGRPGGGLRGGDSPPGNAASLGTRLCTVPDTHGTRSAQSDPLDPTHSST